MSECTMEQESIQCDSCQCWFHQPCINMSMAQYLRFSEPHLQFYCRQCAYCSNVYNFAAALSRIASVAPDVQVMTDKADSELNLLQFYGICLPPVVSVNTDTVRVHKQSVDLLRDHSPWLLDQFVPADVGGDGNCLFRAVSLAVYGHEGVHVQLCLLAAIEVLQHPALYDNSSDGYYMPYKADDCLVLTCYSTFACEIVKLHSYSDMHTVLSLSSVAFFHPAHV